MTATTAPVFTGAGVYTMTDEQYHADPVPGGSLSSTGARAILDSPARFRYDRDHRRGSKAFDVGHAVHAKVLGIGATYTTPPDEHLTPGGKLSTRAETRAWVEAQAAAGVILLTAAELAVVDGMAEAVLAHPLAATLLEQDGQREASVFAPDPDTGVWVRARFDHLADKPVDLKSSASSAGPRGFASTAAAYGYPVQDAHYRDALKWATGVAVPPMRFVVVEKRPPHLVAVHVFDDVTRIAAADLARQARQTYAECTATNTWPGHSDDLIETQMPPWWWHRIDDDADAEMVV